MTQHTNEQSESKSKVSVTEKSDSKAKREKQDKKKTSDREELLIEEDLPILNGYKYTLSYLPSKGPRRRKRIIHCGYDSCGKEFIKAWNFLDHARMHKGEKPFSCHI
jgi:hypothetical protein